MNGDVVERYFREVIDRRSDDLESVFDADCVIWRPEFGDPIRGIAQLRRFLALTRMSLTSTTTEILRLISDGDFIAARVRHQATFANAIATPLGIRDVAGRSVTWNAQAQFRLTNGRIAEEWVVRDEIGILRQLDVFST